LIEAEMRALIGETYIALQKLTLAEEQINQGLALRKEILGPDHSDVARSYNSLTQLERLNANNVEALVAAKEAVRIDKLGENPYGEMTMNSYERLSENLVIGNQFAAADSILNIMETHLSPDLKNFHTVQASIYHQRARVTIAGPENFALGDSLGKISAGILEDHFPNSPTLGTYYNNIAVNLMVGVRDLDQAGVYFEKALATFARLLGEDHPEYALTLENLGGIAYRQQRYDDCLANLERVLDIRVRNLGADHPIAMRTMMNMGAVSSGTGNYDRAIEIYDEVMPLLVAVNGELHLDTATGLRNQGYAYHGAGRLAEAEVVLNRSADLFQELQGPNRSSEARSLDKLAEIKMDQGEWAAAEALMVKAFPVLEETYGSDHARTIQSAAKFVQIYEALSQPQNVDKYRVYVADK
jgi:tetratricopeptide (TPR) repeat protein